MSWDVVLFSSSEKIKSIETLNPKALKPDDFCKKLKVYFPAIEEEDQFRLISIGESTIEYTFSAAPVNNMMFNLYGEPALTALAAFAKKNGYQVFDTALNAMLDLNKPEVNGYKNYLANLKDDLLKK